MSNVLYLVHRIPYPPNKGDKIRSFNFLRHLSKRHSIYLGAFVDNPADWQHEHAIREYCAEVFLRPIGGWRSRVSALRSLAQSNPLTVGYFSDKHMEKWVRETLAVRSIDTAIAFSSTMAQYLPEQEAGRARMIADFVDLDSDKWRQYRESSRLPKSLLYAYEAWALAAWEAAVADRVNAVTLISEAERDMLREKTGVQRGNVEVVHNGVDLEYFDPSIRFDNPYPNTKPIVVFTGAMDYFANVDGVCWFAESIWPLVVENVPQAEFWIVGSSPTPRVEALERISGVHVTGAVADIRPYLKYASVAVAPLRIARGVQNKLLEALAMNQPVVATRIATEGVEESAVLEANAPHEFADLVCEVLETNVRSKWESGRAYVRSKFDWDRNLKRFEDLGGLADG